MIALSTLLASSGELRIDPQESALEKLSMALKELLPDQGPLHMQPLPTTPAAAGGPKRQLRFQPRTLPGGGLEPLWGSRGTRLELLLDETGKQVEVILVTRPLLVESLPTLAGLSLQSANEELQLETVQLDDGSSDWRRLRLIAAEMAVGQESVTLRLVPRGHDELWLEADFEQPQPSLGDFAKLLGYASGARHDIRADLEWLPDELRKGGIVSLQSLDGLFALKHPKTGGIEAGLRQVGTTLSFADGHTWPLIPGFDALTVSALQAHLEVDEPLDSAARRSTIAVSGVLAVEISGGDDVHFPLQARWPDFSVTGEMREEDRLPLGRLLQWLGLPASDPAHPEHSLEITRLAFSAEPTGENKAFRFLAEIGNVWSIAFPAGEVELSRLGLDLDHRGGELDVTLLADLVIRSRPLAVMAQRTGTEWTFTGRLGPDADLHLGDWLGEFAATIADIEIPGSIAAFTLDYVELAFHSKHRDLSLKLDCSVGKQLQAELELELTHQADGSLQQTWGGFLAYGPRRFELHFERDGGDLLVASYAGGGHDRLTLQQIAAIGGVTLPPSVNLSVELRSLLLARESTAGQPTLSLFAADFGAGLDLSALPLLGKVLPVEERLALTLQLVGASVEVLESDVAKRIAPVNARLPAAATPLPDAGDPALRKGLNLAAKLMLGGAPIDIGLPLGTDDSGAPVDNSGSGEAPTPGPAPAAQDDGTHWVRLQKHFGPVHVERVGLRYADAELAMLVDGALGAGPLTLSLEGLGLRSKLQPLAPHFELHGLGLDFSSGPVEIGGALLRNQRTDPASGEQYDSFDGAAVLKAKTLTLSALGSYAKLHGQPSLFVYALLDYPLGGPSFFFVTGLAAGFGYNRSLLMPKIDTVSAYPLVQSALKPAAAVKDVGGALEQLHQYLPVDVGQYFLAVGVKFNSFKLIDSFAMLAVSFGHQFELDVLGLSTLIVPSPETDKEATPLAEVQLAIKARFAPAEHLLSVEAQLTTASFILSRDCHLRGGFAFYSWFSGGNAGDFVVTLGGYHPDFKVPPHYPRVPRLGFSWQPTDSVQIKGEAYYALTGHTLMAGGALQATYHDGDLRAWFRADADFLLNWAPYYYTAHMDVHIGGSYTIHFFGAHQISVEVGAAVWLHGPEFAGHARVDLTVTHIDFDFGTQDTTEPEKLTWSEFSRQFLPADDQMCHVTISHGLLASGNEKQPSGLQVVNPSHFEATLTSQVPVSGPSHPKVQVGPAAIDRYLEAAGEGRLIQSMKRFLASRLFLSTSVFGTVLSLQMLVAWFLRPLRAEAEAR